MIQAIIIVGNWASGKTELLHFIEEQLANRNVPVVTDSDRLRFEEGVLQDAVERGKLDPQQSIHVGEHSYLTKDGPPGYRHFRVRDGVIPNSAHEKMIADIALQPNGQLRLVEFAMGPNIDEFEGQKRTTFYQDGKYLLELVEKYGLLNRVLVIELVAPLETRLKRQIERDDSTDMEAFCAFAPDGGELYPHAEKLGDGYIRFDNAINDDEMFRERATEILREHILPEIHHEGSGSQIERGARKES